MLPERGKNREISNWCRCCSRSSCACLHNFHKSPIGLIVGTDNPLSSKVLFSLRLRTFMFSFGTSMSQSSPPIYVLLFYASRELLLGEKALLASLHPWGLGDTWCVLVLATSLPNDNPRSVRTEHEEIHDSSNFARKPQLFYSCHAIADKGIIYRLLSMKSTVSMKIKLINNSASMSRVAMRIANWSVGNC